MESNKLNIALSVKILFVASNPTNTSNLGLDEEIREISEKVRLSDHGNLIKIVSSWATRPDDLLQAFNMHKPQIVHFSGHGTANNEILLIDKNGLSKPISTEAISALFKTVKDNIKLVLLNACFSKTQAQAITKIVDCAIGMNSSIGDQAAIIFAASFYRAIGFGRSVLGAFEQGITAILLEGIPENNIPELIVKNGVDASNLYLVNPISLSNNIKKSQRNKEVFDLQIVNNSPLCLPPTVVPFVDRLTETNRILRVLKNKGVAVIFGFSGIGKTALASHIVHLLVDESFFDDGILWLDLRNIINLNQIIRYISKSFNLPSSEIENSIDLIPFLSAKKALIVFDNADEISSSDINSLLNVRGRCSVLVTTRKANLAMIGSTRQPLLPLPLDDAVNFLCDRLYSEIISDKDCLYSICNQLGCLPLAIELASTFIIVNELTPHDYMNILNNKLLTGIEEIKTAFDLSYDNLSSNAQKALKVISLLDGEDFNAETVASGIELNINEVKSLFNEILSNSLIKKSYILSRYKIHPLLKEYAYEKIYANEINRFMDCLIDYFLHFCQQYGGFNNFQKWDILEIELRNIIPIVDWCYKENRIKEYLQFYELITHCLQVRGYSTEVLNSTQQMFDLGRKYFDNPSVLWLLAHRIMRMTYQGRYDISMKIIEFLQPIFKKRRDLSGLAHMERNLGEIEEYKGNYANAKLCYEKTLKIAIQLPDTSSEELPFHNRKSRIAWTTWKIGRITRKMENFSFFVLPGLLGKLGE